jgi:DNA polymerase III delta prime subunit
MTFDDVISQEYTTEALKSQIISGKTAHAYLFTGSRGTGKTTKKQKKNKKKREKKETQKKKKKKKRT